MDNKIKIYPWLFHELSSQLYGKNVIPCHGSTLIINNM